MTNELEERLVASWEKIATALEGIHEHARTAVSKHWPEPREPRESIVTKAESEEERLLKEQGKTVKQADITGWLGEDFGGEEPIGPREREYLERQKQRDADASSQADGFGGPPEGSPETAQGEPRSAGEGPTDRTPAQDS